MNWQEIEEILGEDNDMQLLGLTEEHYRQLLTGHVLHDISDKEAESFCYYCWQKHHNAVATFMLSRPFADDDVKHSDFWQCGARTYIYLCTDHARVQPYYGVYKWDEANKQMHIRPQVSDMANDPSEQSEAGDWETQYEEWRNTIQSIHGVSASFVRTWATLDDGERELFKRTSIREQLAEESK